MPKRQNPREHRLLLAAVIIRDRDACLLCLKTEFKPRERTLDHLNNRKRDNRLVNLHLLCRSCNAGENNRLRCGKQRLLTTKTRAKYRARLFREIPASSQVPPVCVEREQPKDPPVLKDRNNLKPRHLRGFGKFDETNWILEPPYREHVFQCVKEQGNISKGDALYAGAEFLQQRFHQGSPETTRKYLRKMASAEGFLEERRDEHGRSMFVFRAGIDLDAWGKKLREEADVH